MGQGEKVGTSVVKDSLEVRGRGGWGISKHGGAQHQDRLLESPQRPPPEDFRLRSVGLGLPGTAALRGCIRIHP